MTQIKYTSLLNNKTALPLNLMRMPPILKSPINPHPQKDSIYITKFTHVDRFVIGYASSWVLFIYMFWGRFIFHILFCIWHCTVNIVHISIHSLRWSETNFQNRISHDSSSSNTSPHISHVSSNVLWILFRTSWWTFKTSISDRSKYYTFVIHLPYYPFCIQKNYPLHLGEWTIKKSIRNPNIIHLLSIFLLASWQMNSICISDACLEWSPRCNG